MRSMLPRNIIVIHDTNEEAAKMILNDFHVQPNVPQTPCMFRSSHNTNTLFDHNNRRARQNLVTSLLKGKLIPEETKKTTHVFPDSKRIKLEQPNQQIIKFVKSFRHKDENQLFNLFLQTFSDHKIVLFCLLDSDN